jgi:hypothetical protein
MKPTTNNEYGTKRKHTNLIYYKGGKLRYIFDTTIPSKVSAFVLKHKNLTAATATAANQGSEKISFNNNTFRRNTTQRYT